MKALAVMLAGSAMLVAIGASQPAWSEQKTAKACTEEWRANKDANQAKGITLKAYLEQCRTGTAALQPAAAPAAPAPTTGTAPSHPAPERAAVGALGLNQFGNEAQAKGHCPRDTVVWVNLSSNIYHFAGSKDYGTTKHGAYMCEKDTTAQGMRPAKNEKHPG